jgi:predicted HAD superfamily hydrolase
MTTAYSFDVFDTCLTRTFARPEDLFIELARRLLPPEASAEAVTDLARQREQAEAAARAAAPREDITLAEIYHHFEPALTGWGLSPQIALTTEVNLEITCVRPIQAMQQRLAQLRRQGRRILFISDMYLPAPVIHLMLINHGLARPADPLYVSGEIGLTKQSGRLFEHVLAQEKLLPAQLHHHGDNPHADVIMARRLGIRATYFQQTRLNRFEQLTLRTGPAAPAQSRLAAVSRAVRLQFQSDDLSPVTIDMIANVIAPLLTAYVAWVLLDARKNGVERLYFVARDGQVLHAIARILARYLPVPELHYLYGSRQAWFLPGVFECMPAQLDWLTLHSTTPRHMLKKLNLTPEEIAPVLRTHQLNNWDTHLAPAELSRFWQVIQHPPVTALILQQAAAARQLTLAYFEQNGLFDAQKWALVDVGWTLKSQRAVRRMVQTVTPTIEAQAYYLGVTNERIPITDSGPYRAFITEVSGPQPVNLPGQQLFRNINMVEQFFTMADHGSTTGYCYTDNRIQPLLAAEPMTDHRRKFAAEMQRVICAYADEFVRAGLLNDISVARQTVLAGFDEFAANPTRQEAQAIAWVPVGQDQNETRRHQLARPLTLDDIFYYVGRATHLIADRDFSAGHSWWAGSMALSSRWVRLLFAGARRTIDFRAAGGFLTLRRWWWKLKGTEII